MPGELRGWGRLAALLAAAAAATPGVAAAQLPAASPPAPSQEEGPARAAPDAPRAGPAQPAINALLEQAAYWRSRNQPERVLAALQRLLTARPDDADALAQAVDAAALVGQQQAAAAYLERLRQVAPNDPRIGRAEASLVVASEGGATLAEARRLATENRLTEAVARYRSLFRNDQVPPFLLQEFMSVLAGSSDAGYAEAVQRMRRQLAATPRDAQLRLTFAIQLGNREENREEAINELRALMRMPAVAAQARAALRQIYLWEPATPSSIEPIEELLRANPNDPELTEKLAASRDTRRTLDRLVGWNLIGGSRLREAETHLEGLLANDPNDVEALMAFSVLRGLQNRLPEMRRFRDRAIAASPDRAEEFQRMTEDFGRVGPGGGGAAAVAPFSPSTAARQALAANDLARADRLARTALRSRGDERVGGEIVLGQIALRREEAEQAEQRFRAALSLRPNTPEAQTGLYFALQAQNRFAEADALQQGAGFAAPAGANVGRAFAIREEASRLREDAVAIEMLQRALNLDPGNVYVRIDLVRRLRAAYRPAEAREVEQQLATSRDADALAAAALLATEEDRFAEAVALLDRVPTRLRTAEAGRLLAQARFETQVRRLENEARLGSAPAAAQLAALAARPDPTGVAAPAVIRALGRLNAKEGAGAAARAALAANPRMSAADRLGLAAALMEVQQTEEASNLLEAASREAALGAEDRRQLTFLRETAAVRRSDRLNDEGDQASAYEELAPHLRGAASAQVATALMRLYARTRRFAEAREIADALLARDPMNPDIRASAVDLAVQMQDYATAEALLAEGRRYNVGSTNLLLAEARVARARRNPVRELRALEGAARSRMDELRVNDPAQRAAMGAEILSPARAGSRPTSELADVATGEILRELSRARDEAASWVQAGLGVTNRTGTGGLSRNTTVTTPLEASIAVPGLQGRLQVQTGTVAILAGRISGNSASLRQFGTNPLATTANSARGDESQLGVPLGIGFQAERFRADVGSTPLGFRRSNVVGGVEVLVPVLQGVGLRLVGERRAVTNSMLSYAGQQDALTGRSWGAVTRNGGRAQLEFTLGDDWGAYASAGAAQISGEGVRSNRSLEVGGGVYRSVINRPNEALTLGVDLRHIAYDRNLSGFTLGQGGYFSPQNSNVISLQADYRRQLGDWTLRAVGAVGWQRYRTGNSPVFPNDPALQGRLEIAAATDPTLSTFTGGQRVSGPTGSLALNAEYAISQDLRVGGAARFTRTGDFQDVTGLVYLRYRIDRSARDVRPMLGEAAKPYPFGSYPFPGSVNAGRPEPVQVPSESTRPVW